MCASETVIPLRRLAGSVVLLSGLLVATTTAALDDLADESLSEAVVQTVQGGPAPMAPETTLTGRQATDLVDLQQGMPRTTPAVQEERGSLVQPVGNGLNIWLGPIH